jgi:hypothetical protein
MKAGREHRVPLSNRAISILKQLRDPEGCEFVFPGQKPKKPLSNMAMEMVLRRMEIENATVHGFRSSFRDWAGNVTSLPREVIETALAHVIGDKVEQAYRRGDALEKRRVLMDAWASFCEPTVNGSHCVSVQARKVRPSTRNREATPRVRSSFPSAAVGKSSPSGGRNSAVPTQASGNSSCIRRTARVYGLERRAPCVERRRKSPGAVACRICTNRRTLCDRETGPRLHRRRASGRS